MNEHKKIISLIAVHIIVSDKEIDNKELEVLYNYNNDCIEIENEINDIYSDSDNKISLENLLAQLANYPNEIILEAYQLFLEVIYSDGYYDRNEKEILNKIREKLIIDDTVFYQIENRISSNIKLYNEKAETWSDNLKVNFYGFMSKLSTKEDSVFKKRQKEILLNGPKFVEKIKDISEYARHDLALAEKSLKKSSKSISDLLDNLSEHAEKLKIAKRKDKQLDDFIVSLQKNVKENALNQLKENIKVVNKKKRTIDYFTISFLGRTKAGKSTLHSIITKEGNEAIGEGKVRTTRYNRVYNWENIRIIDTPGIGAPNGTSDVEIAESVVDESDLICYVVTNDAIQETEFKFLSEIKKKNKPVVILLNVKENIEDERRKKIFLKNPTKWKERTDNKSIRGHIERINDYMTKYYHNNFYKVIPVMLLSAKLSENEIDIKLKNVLYQASNIDEFLSSLKDTVFENGHLRKSQNIIDGSNIRLNSIMQSFSEQFTAISSIIHRLKKEKSAFSEFLAKNREKYTKNLSGEIDTYVLKLKKFAKDFATNNYELNGEEVAKQWDLDLKNRGYKKQLENKIKDEFENIQDEIKSRLNESLDSFQIFFNNQTFNVVTKSTFNTRSLFNVGGSLLGVIGSIILMSNPVGWFVIGAGVLVGLAQKLFKSKKKKIKEAQEKIEDSLISGIEDLQNEYKEKVKKSLYKMLNDYDKSVNSNMEKIIIQAKQIKDLLNEELKISKDRVSLLNKAMLIRVFQHTKHIEFEKNIEVSLANDKSILQVQREFDKNIIKLKTTNKLKTNEINMISELIQSELKIVNN